MADKCLQELEDALSKSKIEMEKYRKEDNLSPYEGANPASKLANYVSKHRSAEREKRNTRYKQAGRWIVKVPSVIEWLKQEKDAKKLIDGLETDARVDLEKTEDAKKAAKAVVENHGAHKKNDVPLTPPKAFEIGARVELIDASGCKEWNVVPRIGDIGTVKSGSLESG
eukprot:CAMPEP_0169091514 /NCGR_PEP_ID=MMETSP1015-20121227/16403_1 /TAXON_ID=342587 /ORGANISM="Karlodinium micrum, Strain CCMP2283" /LENGTH=168 /DNA_ID=CAMNT_0009152011 /DNA_START=1 /DNA_END=503 /DNA_ORIENTATION=+